MFVGIRLGMPNGPGGGAGAGTPTILLDNSSLIENSPEDTPVGDFSVANGSGIYTFSLTDAAGNRFKVSGTNGVDLVAGPTASNYEAAPSYDITVEADNGVDTPLSRTITISIVNELEITLGNLALNNSDIDDGATEDTIVGAVQGLSSGSTIAITDTAGGRFKLSGSNVVAGSVPTDYDTATSHNITIRETNVDASNSPRDSVIAITVNGPPTPGSGSTDFSISGNALVAILEDF